MSKVENVEQAARLAKAMASDIAIYNVEKIKRGIEEDRLFDELADDIREGEQMWASRIAPEIVKGTNLFQKAFIDVIFSHAANVKSKIF